MQSQVPPALGLRTVRRAPIRLLTAAAGMGVAVAIAVAPLGSPSTTPVALRWSLACGVIGCLLAAAGIAGWSPGIGWSMLLLGSGYAVSLVGRGATADAGVVAIAPGLLVSAELGYWSLDARGPAGDATELVRRAALLLGLAVLALAAAGAVTLAVSLPDAGGLPVAAAGVAGAVGLVAILTVLACSPRRAPN
jgi:hypothetical protein